MTRLALLGTLIGGLVASGCSRSSEPPVTIAFSAAVRGAPFACDEGVAGFTMQDLRLYAYGFELLAADGSVAPVRLEDDGVAQDGEVVLLDFEDGSGHCRNGTAGLRQHVAGTAPRGEYTGLRFRIGVPFAKNHGDPAVARPPLNLGRMNWGWRAGYKFLRFEALDEQGRSLRLHLGSTGCTGQIGAISGCRWPNRPEVELTEFDASRDTVVLELAPLLAALGAAAGDGSCMGEHDDPDCQALWPVLGLDGAGDAERPTVLGSVRRGGP